MQRSASDKHEKLQKLYGRIAVQSELITAVAILVIRINTMVVIPAIIYASLLAFSVLQYFKTKKIPIPVNANVTIRYKI